MEKFKWKGALKQYLRWPLYVGLLLGAGSIVLFRIDRKAGLAAAAVVFLYIVVVSVSLVRLKKQILNELTGFALQFKTIEGDLLKEMETPYALIDLKGRLIWGNKAFTGLSGRNALYHGSIESVFPSMKGVGISSLIRNRDQENHEEEPGDTAGGSQWEKKPRPAQKTDSDAEKLISHEGRIYRLRAERVNLSGLVRNVSFLEGYEEGTELVSLYFYDETELRSLARQYEEEKLVVALVYIDNYEEALENVEDVRKSLLMALIERKISQYFTELDGIVRKTEKDRFIIILKKKALDALKEQKFHILEEVKTVNAGNTMAMTVSIGFGVNGVSFQQNADYARIAIEMALGRGGDQVVVKDGSAISYYGGKSLQMEKNTRVKARVKAQALREFIASKEQVVVMGHKITDVDALGAAIGIYRIGVTLGKPVHIVVNDPTTSIRPLMAGFLDNPEYGSGMFIDSSAAKNLVDNNTVVVVVDTNKPSYTECKELLSLTKTIVVLDHHRRGNEVIDNAVLSYVEPYASSACEMVSEIVQYFGDDIKLRSMEADCLYAGIVIDTNNFITRSGVRTFEAAAYLRRNGADTTRVRKMLRDNIDSYKAKAEAVRTAEIYQKYFAIGVCPSEGIESPTVVGAQAANELLNIAGVKASFVLTSFNQEIYVSARAIDEVNVQVLMEQLGGGGHLNIAGAQVKATPEEAKAMLKEIIDRFIAEGGLSQ